MLILNKLLGLHEFSAYSYMVGVDRWAVCMTLTFDLDKAKMNQRPEYLGQRSFRSKGWFVNWGLTARSTEFRSYRAFKVVIYFVEKYRPNTHIPDWLLYLDH